MVGVEVPDRRFKGGADAISNPSGRMSPIGGNAATCTGSPILVNVVEVIQRNQASVVVLTARTCSILPSALAEN